MSFDLNMVKMPAKFYQQRRASEKMFVVQELLNIENHLKVDGDTYTSKEEEYFNRMWCIVLQKVDENNDPKLAVFLKSRKPAGARAQAMDLSLGIELYTRSYPRTTAELDVKFEDDQLVEQHGVAIYSWEDLKMTEEEEKKEIKPRKIPDAELKKQKLHNAVGKPQFVFQFPHAVRIKVKVNKTDLLHGDFMRGTNTPNEVAFVVGGQKFFVTRKDFNELPRRIQYAQKPGSRYGKSLENDVDPLDFQSFLRVTSTPKGTPIPIDDTNVEGVLVASSTLSAREIVSLCKSFVEKESEKSLEKKFQLALQYGWDELKDHCLLKFESAQRLYDSIPSYLETLTTSEAQEKWEEIVKANNLETARLAKKSEGSDDSDDDSDDDDDDDDEEEEEDELEDQDQDQEDSDSMEEEDEPPKKRFHTGLLDSDSDSDSD